MANSLPFNAVAVDGEYDRVYKAEDWAWYFATFIANGIFPKPSDGLQVVAYSGMEIRVNAGYAFINGYAFRNPATLSVTLDTAEGALNRVDRVVVRWDLPQRDMYIAVQLQIEELAAAMQEVKKQAEAGTKETKEAIAALDERLKRVESGWGIDYKHDAVLGLCYMGAAYMSQHYERTVETAVLGATYVGNSYLANTF